MDQTPSAHPADRLIRELIGSGRAAAPEEIARIADRIAAAPFNPEMVRVPTVDRGVSYQGRTLGARELSLRYHLVKRVAIDEQGTPWTTSAQYLEDLHRAALHVTARLGVYERRGDQIAAMIVRTERVLPSERRGQRFLPNLIVVYSAHRGIIVTGYQFSALEQLNLPMEVRWLG